MMRKQRDKNKNEKDGFREDGIVIEMNEDKYRPRPSTRVLKLTANIITLAVLIAFCMGSLGERLIEAGDEPTSASIGEAFDRRNASASIPSAARISDVPLPSVEAEALPSESLPEGYIECDLSCEPLSLINETSYEPDCAALLEADSAAAEAVSYSLAADGGEPIALVLHTHGTECYAPANGEAADYTFRSTDIEENVVAVGAVLAETLRENGVETLHCTVMHDQPSYLNSYVRAAETIFATLEQFPSILYIFDVHRDAIERDGSVVRPCTYFNGETVAQVMSVVGTDERGASHPNWRTNLTLALRLQLKADELCPSISRAVNLRSASFNEQYAPGSLLLEIGSHGNTLDEAKRAAVFIGHALASLINGR